MRTHKCMCQSKHDFTRLSLYIPINVKLSAQARDRISAQSPPSLNMLISIDRPAVVPSLGERPNGERKKRNVTGGGADFGGRGQK